VLAVATGKPVPAGSVEVIEVVLEAVVAEEGLVAAGPHNRSRSKRFG
jgi:hypothetical protein